MPLLLYSEQRSFFKEIEASRCLDFLEDTKCNLRLFEIKVSLLLETQKTSSPKLFLDNFKTLRVLLLQESISQYYQRTCCFNYSANVRQGIHLETDLGQLAHIFLIKNETGSLDFQFLMMRLSVRTTVQLLIQLYC